MIPYWTEISMLIFGQCFLAHASLVILGYLCHGKGLFFTETNACHENQVAFPPWSSFAYVYCTFASRLFWCHLYCFCYYFNISRVFQFIDFWSGMHVLLALLLTMHCYSHTSYTNLYICMQCHSRFSYFHSRFLVPFFLNSIFVIKIWKTIRRDKEHDRKNSKLSFF